MQGPSQGFQGAELAGLLLLIGVSAFLLRGPLTHLRHASPGMFQLVLGGALGLLAAIIVLVLQGDLVPDGFEQVARMLLVGGLVLAGLVFVWREFVS